jgi:hypothetical protein
MPYVLSERPLFSVNVVSELVTSCRDSNCVWEGGSSWSGTCNDWRPLERNFCSDFGAADPTEKYWTHGTEVTCFCSTTLTHRASGRPRTAARNPASSDGIPWFPVWRFVAFVCASRYIALYWRTSYELQRQACKMYCTKLTSHVSALWKASVYVCFYEHSCPSV